MHEQPGENIIEWIEVAPIGRLVRKIVFAGAAALFVAAVPFVLALSTFRWFALEPTNYLTVQERHSVARLNGLTRDELAALDRALVRYFQSDRRSFAAALEQEGVVRSPYSARDVAHLEDVHDLVRGALDLQRLAVGYGLVFVAGALLLSSWRHAARCTLVGSLLTVALLGSLGLLSLLDWDKLFLQFHFVSFDNELWRLDPGRDALIRLYPPPFHMDAAIVLIAMSVLEAMLLAVLAALLLRRGARRKWRMA